MKRRLTPHPGLPPGWQKKCKTNSLQDHSMNQPHDSFSPIWSSLPQHSQYLGGFLIAAPLSPVCDQLGLVWLSGEKKYSTQAREPITAASVSHSPDWVGSCTKDACWNWCWCSALFSCGRQALRDEKASPASQNLNHCTWQAIIVTDRFHLNVFGLVFYSEGDLEWQSMNYERQK